jgi:hypothetical protein
VFGSVNGFSYIKMSFIRQIGNNPSVKVFGYRFFNYDEEVELTISYRVPESNLWEEDFEKIIDTFSFTTKK